MAVERNIVFIYPLSKKLTELKEELEKDDEVIIYELDSSAEYTQIIGILEYSITFSSDLKKTISILDENKKFTRGKNSKNFLVQNKTIPSHIFSKYQKVGLNEVIQEDTLLKAMIHKVKMFFNPLDAKEKMEEEIKNKAVMSQTVLKDQTISGNADKGINNKNEKQHIEKMAIIGDENPNKFLNKKKSSYDASAFEHGGPSSNLSLKSKGTFFTSSFNNLQRKKLKTFDPVSQMGKLKKGSFEAFNNPDFNQKKSTSLNLQAAGELNKKDIPKLDLPESIAPERKKTNFKEITEEFNRKKVNLQLDENDLNRKKKTFEEIEQEINKKKGIIFNETQLNQSKKKAFEEVLVDLEKKKKSIDETEEMLKKKKKELLLLEQDFNKKKSSFKEVAPEEKKKLIQLSDEILEVDKKKKAAFIEIDLLTKKNTTQIDEIINDPKIKKVISFNPEDDKSQKRTNQDQTLELNKKDGTGFVELDIEKNKSEIFNEVDIEAKKKKLFEEVDGPYTKKQKKFEEFQDESQNSKGSNQQSEEINKKKYGTFVEVTNDLNKKGIINIASNKKSKSGEEELSFEKEKDFEENILDYSKFKKQYRDGELSDVESEKTVEITKKNIDELLEEPEYHFYENKSFGFEYLVLHNNFLLQASTSPKSLFKFIHFALLKEYQASVSFYLLLPDADPENVLGLSDYECLYNGNKLEIEGLTEEENLVFMEQNMLLWKDVRLPTWRDETFQVKVNEFIYPYFEDGVYMGFAVSQYEGSVHSFEDAQKIELLSMCLRGTFIDEFSKGAGN